MIKSFGNKQTEALFCGNCPRRWLGFLKSPPGNRLEALSGSRKEQHSIRINNRWRICFRWDDGDAFNVEIVDYH